MSIEPRPTPIKPRPKGGGLPPVQRCRKPEPDRELEGERLWTVDMCANVAFNLKKRPASHYPADQPVPRRRYEFCSVRPIRAKGFQLPDGGGEVCRHHYGRLVKFPDNRWRVVFCTRPASGMRRYSIGHFFREPKKRKVGIVPIGTDPARKETGIKPGRFGVLASYQTPEVTEIHLHSNVRCCWDIPT